MLQVFAANCSTRQTAPSTRASCFAKSATPANSALRATASVAVLAACPWTKASIFKRRTSECICRRTTSTPNNTLFFPYSWVAYYQRGPTVGSISVVLPSPRKDILHVRETESRPINRREPSVIHPAWLFSWSQSRRQQLGRSRCLRKTPGRQENTRLRVQRVRQSEPRFSTFFPSPVSFKFPMTHDEERISSASILLFFPRKKLDLDGPLCPDSWI